jgi:hypothetical protein
MGFAFEERDDGGTHFEVRFAKTKPKDALFLEHIWPDVQAGLAGRHEILRGLLAEHEDRARCDSRQLIPNAEWRSLRSGPPVFRCSR